MQLKRLLNRKDKEQHLHNLSQIKTLIDTALGKTKADILIVNGNLLNVYSGEVLKDYSVAIKGDKIAYVGESAAHTIGSNTKVIDATGKTLIPGLIDAHIHLAALCTVDEFLKYAIKGGTTTIITETVEIAFRLGYRGILQFLKSIKGQPIKIFATISPLLTLSPATQASVLPTKILQRLLKRKDIVGLGESFWSFVVQGDKRILELYADALTSGKKIEGHSAGARGNKLVAYTAAGVSSCHEPINAEEVLERLRLGIKVMIREGKIRQDLEAIAKIKDKGIDFRRLMFATDGVSPQHLMEYGYMEFVVQKAINLGFNPIVAIQMATINAAEHFSLDSLIGGIAPGKYADIVIIPDLQTIQAEMVISNGKIIAQNGQVLVPPKRYTYPKSSLKSIRLPRKLETTDFDIPVEAQDTPVTVRVIHQVTELITREEQTAITPVKGLLEADVERDILKVAVIERTNDPGKMFVGLVKGFGMKKGAFASSGTWALSGIIVIGTNNKDMAIAVNRILELQGGIVVCAEGKVLAEMPTPIGGYIPDLPLETIAQKSEEIQQKATELGIPFPNAHLTLTALTGTAIPFFRICEAGLMDLRENKVVGLIEIV